MFWFCESSFLVVKRWAVNVLWLCVLVQVLPGRKKKKRQHYVRSNAQNLPLMSEHAKLFSLPHVCFTAAMRSFMEQMSLTEGRRLPTGSSASLGWIFLFYFFKNRPHFLWCVGSYCIKPLKEMLVVILPCAVAKRNEELIPSCVQLQL